MRVQLVSNVGIYHDLYTNYDNVDGVVLQCFNGSPMLGRVDWMFSVLRQL